MNIKRVVLSLAVSLVMVPIAVVAYQYQRDTSADYPATSTASSAERASRGAYLARAGNCMACHTARGGQPYAGGRPIGTPFGTIYAPNLTPDRTTGIGTWSADDFWRAMHEGKSKDGSFLYPAFPYPNYTKVTRADSDALFAFMRSVPAVTQPNREHALRFPYNQRVVLAFWRALYFRPGVFEPDSSRSAQWNRGAYLVEGLGHCSACHTARNAVGGSTASDLGGGMIPVSNWYAPALSPGGESGLGVRRDADIADLLHTGVSRRGAVFGPMAEVVATSLQHLSPVDIAAMVGYLRSLPEQVPGKPGDVLAVPADADAVVKRGRQLYGRFCVECHGAQGQGNAPAYPPLAGSHSLSAPTAVNAIRIVLNGGYPPSTSGNPRPYGMPPFGPALSDREVADVVFYARSAWGNPGAVVSEVQVSRLRGAPVD